MTTGKIVGGIFLARDELLWVEELAVGTSADLINDGWLEIDKDATWDVLAGTGLREEGVKSIVTTTDGLVRWHLAIWLDAVSCRRVRKGSELERERREMSRPSRLGFGLTR